MLYLSRGAEMIERWEELKEKALRESEERYRSLLDTMNDGFGIQDEDGAELYAGENPRGIHNISPGID